MIQADQADQKGPEQAEFRHFSRFRFKKSRKGPNTWATQSTMLIHVAPMEC